jgi:hypothetical protein
MKFRPHGFYPYILSIAIAVVASAVTAHAQFSISLSTSDSTTQNAPSGEIDFLATASNSGSSITKIVFYRNDVPYKTFVGSDTSRVLTEDELGEDTYKYRARAYNATTFVDSNEIQVTINTPFVFKMGQTIPAFDIYSSMATSGPGRATDHTEQIKRAVKYLNHRGGGTLYFPCTPAPYPWDPNTIDPCTTSTIPSRSRRM